jgi:predicted amidohydrolase YtcJ
MAEIGWDVTAGKYADFLVLDRNLLDIPIDDIDQTEVLMTVFSGRLVYAKESN